MANQPRKLKKKTPAAGPYEQFTVEDMVAALGARIRDLEVQHYLLHMAIIELRAVGPDHPEEASEAIQGRAATMKELELVIQQLKDERDKLTNE